MFNAQNRIRQLMAERGWTIYRLAQESGLSQTTISNIFKRNNQPSLPTVNAICDACGITLAQFFTENDTANSPNAKSELDNSVAALKEDQREALAAFIKTIDKPLCNQRFQRGFGPSSAARTHGLLVPNQARYQLRYTRILLILE